MTRFDTLSANLPSLYRPANDDPDGEALKLRVTDVLMINGETPADGTVTESGMSLVITLPEDTKIESIELHPSSAAGNTLLLEFYRLAGDLFQSRPLLVAQVKDAVVRINSTFVAQRFGVRLKRPGLLTRLLRTVANMAEQASLDETTVLQSHWFKYADSALYHPYAVRSRELADKATPLASDPSLDLFPYIHDLARLSALMALPPWQEPPELRERVEAYRDRIRKIVALYRNGLGTVDAIRAMTTAQLPPRIVVPEGEETDAERSLRLENEEHPFWIEEFAPLIKQSVLAESTTDGVPTGILGPLMRWYVNRELGSYPIAPTFYITGMTPEAGEIDATQNPTIEYFIGDADAEPTGYAGVGLAWEGTVPPDQTLRLRPTGLSYLGTESGTLLAENLSYTDPTASSGWESIADSPTSQTTALALSADGMVWCGTDADADPNLWRYDGQTWTDVLASDPVTGGVHALLADKNRLLIGAENGLFAYGWYDETPTITELYASDAVMAILRTDDGEIWFGTETGARLLADDDTTSPTSLNGIAVNAIAEGVGGTLVFGTDLGVLMYQQGFNHWYWYSGESGSDQDNDWQLWDPGSPLPTEETVFLPPVLSLKYASDSTLWIGTENGFARYVAQGDGKGFLNYNTVLQAYPDLCDTAVYDIQIDVRGLVWFLSERGLFRYDGQNLWHYLGDDRVWIKKGRADRLYGARQIPEARGQWRFSRSLDNWQTYNATGVTWEAFGDDLRSTDESAVTAVVWTTGVIADMGTLSDSDFTANDMDVSDGLRIRFKPDETRIVEGGRPFIPPLPTGQSVWRYLSLESETPQEFNSFPAWTVEGRLLPPPEEFMTPAEGRYDVSSRPPKRAYDQSVFAYNPAAKVSMEWMDSSLLTVLVRIQERLSNDLSTTEAIEPAIIERVKSGIKRVRPAGVDVQIAVGNTVIDEET